MADENLLSEEKLNKLHMHVEKCNPQKNPQPTENSTWSCKMRYNST